MNNGTSNIFRGWAGVCVGYLLGFQVLTAADRQIEIRGHITGGLPTSGGGGACGSYNMPKLKAQYQCGGTVYNWGHNWPAATLDHTFVNPLGGVHRAGAGTTLYLEIEAGGCIIPLVRTICTGEIPQNGDPDGLPKYVLDIYIDYAGGQSQPGTQTTNCFVSNVVGSSDLGVCMWYFNDLTGALIGTLVMSPGEPQTFTHCTTGERFPVRQKIGACDAGPANAQYNMGTNGYANGNGYPNDGWAVIGTNDVAGGFIPHSTGSTNLAFSGQAGDAKDSTMREGFNALRDALVVGFANDASRQQQANTALAAIAAGQAGQATAANQVAGNASLSTINSSASAIASSTATIATKSTSMDITLGDIRTSVAGIKTDTGGIKTDTAGIKTDTASIAANQVTSVSKLTDISTIGSAQVTALGGLQTTLNTISANVGANLQHGDAVIMQQSLATIATDGSYTRGSVNSIDNRLATANTTLTSIYGALDGVEGYLDGLEGSLDGVEGLLGQGNAERELIRIKADEMQVDFRSYTNFFKERNADNLSGDLTTQEAAGVGAADTMAAGFDSLAGSVGTAGSVGGSGGALTFSVGGYTFNANPATSPAWSGIASGIKSALSWLCTVLYIFAIWKVTQDYLKAGMQAQQVRAPDVSIFGNSFGVALGIPIAIAITIAIAAIPSVCFTWLSNAGIASFGTNPLSFLASAGSGGAGAVYLANLFLPIDVLLVNMSAYFIFTLTVAGIYSVAATIVRFLVG